MNELRATGTLAVAVGFLLFHAAPGFTESDDQRIKAMVQAGQFREAYEQSLDDGKPDLRRLILTARTLLTTGMQSSDSYLRWYALRAAIPLHEGELAQSARTLSHSADRYEQSLALEILGNGDPQGSRADFLAALDSPFRAVRLRALRGLAKLKDPTLSERFGTVLTGDVDPDLRCFAAKALADSGAADAPLILHRALDDQVRAVQEQTVLALVQLHDGDLVPLIRRKLASDPPEQRLGNIRIAALIPDRNLVGDLAPFFSDAEPEVRAFAAAAVLSILEQTSP